jgi:aldose 1-epimerase
MTSAQRTATISIGRGVVQAEVSPVGAALLELTVAGTRVTPSVSPDDAAEFYVGSIIAPWPNRVANGRYSYQGEDFQLECNETKRQTALHGLSAQHPWSIEASSDDTVTLSTTVGQVPGYPWQIDLLANYLVGENGVTVSLTATNTSATTAPFGAAFHPYFTIPGSALDEWTLQMPAAVVVIPDPDRLLPERDSDVSEAGLDFRDGEHLAEPSLAPPFLDHAFGGFDGAASATLASPNGVGISLGASLGSWMQVHRPDAGPLQGSVVLEPQTCPPNALADSRDVIELAPHEQIHIMWNLMVTVEGATR